MAEQSLKERAENWIERWEDAERAAPLVRDAYSLIEDLQAKCDEAEARVKALEERMARIAKVILVIDGKDIDEANPFETEIDEIWGVATKDLGVSGGKLARGENRE